MALDAPLATHPVHLARAPQQDWSSTLYLAVCKSVQQQAALASPLSILHGSERAVGFHRKRALLTAAGNEVTDRGLTLPGCGGMGELPATELQLLASLPQISELWLHTLVLQS